MFIAKRKSVVEACLALMQWISPGCSQILPLCNNNLEIGCFVQNFQALCTSNELCQFPLLPQFFSFSPCFCLFLCINPNQKVFKPNLRELIPLPILLVLWFLLLFLYSSSYLQKGSYFLLACTLSGEQLFCCSPPNPCNKDNRHKNSFIEMLLEVMLEWRSYLATMTAIQGR